MHMCSSEWKASGAGEPLSPSRSTHYTMWEEVPSPCPVQRIACTSLFGFIKFLLPWYFSTETCKQSTTVWSNSMTTKDCLHCHPHQRWCQLLHKVPGMLSSLQKPSCFASTRAAWKPGCRFWRITTNSWSHSCTGWGSCWSRWVLRPFF